MKTKKLRKRKQINLDSGVYADPCRPFRESHQAWKWKIRVHLAARNSPDWPRAATNCNKKMIISRDQNHANLKYTHMYRRISTSESNTNLKRNFAGLYGVRSPEKTAEKMSSISQAKQFRIFPFTSELAPFLRFVLDTPFFSWQK